MSEIPESYVVETKCENCGEVVLDTNIPMGVKLKDTPCSNCGCKALIDNRGESNGNNTG